MALPIPRDVWRRYWYGVVTIASREGGRDLGADRICWPRLAQGRGGIAADWLDMAVPLVEGGVALDVVHLSSPKDRLRLQLRLSAWSMDK